MFVYLFLFDEGERPTGISTHGVQKIFHRVFANIVAWDDVVVTNTSVKTVTNIYCKKRFTKSVCLGKVNMELQLDAIITVLLISKISSTCFGQTFAHLQERKT
jgi:hypothetical protein